MEWLVGTCIYLCIHLTLYLLIFRHVRAFSSERVIFFYHLGSVVVLVLALSKSDAGWSATLQPLGIAALALHGLYSLSSLELWSLAQGSYSLTILEHVQSLRSAGRAAYVSDILPVYAVGASKRWQRIRSLVRLGLVRRRATYIQLTWFGEIIATALRSIVTITNVEYH